MSVSKFPNLSWNSIAGKPSVQASVFAILYVMSKALEKIHYRNAFYASSYRQLLLLNSCLVIILIGLMIWSSQLAQLRPQAIYFPTTPEGKLIANTPVSVESSTEPEVVAWAEKVAKSVFDFDYVNYRQSLQDLRQYFTAKGHAEYLAALEASTNMEAVKTNRQVVSAEINGQTEIFKKGLESGFFVWQLTVPLLITYENSAGKLLRQNVQATMVIVRGSMLEYPSGLSVHQMILKELDS